MHYTIRHTTRFAYEKIISESVMEARMQPRSEGGQRCIRFGLSTTPASRVRMYQDHDGNVVHHFSIPGRHARLAVTAEALVECMPQALPEVLGSWEELDALTAAGKYWELLNPSPFTRRTELLDRLAVEIGLSREHDPLTTLKRLTSEMYSRFEYSPQSTRVDSPIDEALASRRGVCQDFAHIMIALVRQLGIPCRYVSGYLFHQSDDGTIRSAEDATHAWLEARLPIGGWVGFDPTNNMAAGERHIAVATGRDYADVPPTRGVFKGTSEVRSELLVSVNVGATHTGPARNARAFNSWLSREADAPTQDSDALQQTQQQQQQ